MPVFPGIGTVVNVLAIIPGGLLGLLFKSGLKPRYQDAATLTLGLSVLFIGASGAIQGMLHVEGGLLSGLSTAQTLQLILALVLGALVGEFLDIDGHMEQLGRWLKQKADRGSDSRFVDGFVTASLTVCIGAMAVVGSIQDALAGDPSLLYTKAILDFMIVMVFASTYGKGAIFSALPVGAFQGTITLCAGALQPLLQDLAIQANLSLIGSILIFCVGVNLTFGNRFRVANMLPAIVFGVAFTALL